MPVAAKTANNFGKFHLTKAIHRKYLKEDSSSELHIDNYLIKYFANLYLIAKFVFLNMTGPDDNGQVDHQA